LPKRSLVLSLCAAMNDSAPSHPPHEASDAWLRHYAAAAERRRETATRQRSRPYLHYRRREARWARLIALLALGLMIAWAYLVKK
jgi:hypothetical protein